MKLQKGPVSRRERLFDGTGVVSVWDLLGAAAAPPFTAVLSCELDPGGHVGAHRQQECPEIVIGLDGEGEARVDGTAQPLQSGAVVHLPLGSTLEIRNLSSSDPLRYLIIKAR